ncbi:MAG: GGDEF domain-containing protein [Bacillota bacterium]|nr:GGDEF domain-containing protein [Bacillota bacterium]
MLLIYYRRMRDGSAYSLYFMAILIVTFLLCLMDAAWYYCDNIYIDYSTVNVNSVLAKAIYIIDFILTAGAAYCWFLYVERQLDSTFTSTKTRHMLVRLPLLAVIVMAFLNIRFDLLFFMSNDGDFRGHAYPLFFLIVITYMLVASLHALYHAAKTDDLHEKRRCRTLASFIVFPLIVAILQLFSEIPFTAGITLAVIWIFIEIQGHEISEDVLAGMNNRNRLDRELASHMEHARQSGRTLYMLMMDANNFKQINDRYGHTEGDKVLRSIGTALKKAVSGTDYFIARFGGDEFTALMYSETESKVIELKDRINESINKECNSPYSPYVVSLAIGYARFKPEYSASEFYAKADEALYIEKKKLKAKHDARN